MFWRWTDVSSSNGLEMTQDRNDTCILINMIAEVQSRSCQQTIHLVAPFFIAQTYLKRVMPVTKNISRLLKENIFSIGFCFEELSPTSVECLR